MERARRKYLARHAEPEAAMARAVDRRYARALVVPACRETAALLDGYADAAARASGRTLCVLVVNGSESASGHTHSVNLALLRDVRERGDRWRELRPSASPEPTATVGPDLGPARASLGRLAAFDVLLVDRASPGLCIPGERGVGLARKIGCDLALALHCQGSVESDWIFCTDADATLPSDYFERIDRAGLGPRDGLAAPWDAAAPRELAAALYAFSHEPSGDEAVDVATALYEIWLRHYVLGLASAGSPYAMHAVGSTMAVRAGAYAAVRGFPRRAAGEDFHVLNKLAKIGAVARLDGDPIRVRARRSDRAPFGTGRGVERLAAKGGELRLYDPTTFVVLGRWLESLGAFAVHRSVDRVRLEVADLDATARGAVGPFLDSIGAHGALRAADAGSKSADVLVRRLQTWFDGFRTLKLVHALRDRAFPSLPWRPAPAAIEDGEASRPSRSARDLAALRAICASLSERESLLPPLVGVGAMFARCRATSSGKLRKRTVDPPF